MTELLMNLESNIIRNQIIRDQIVYLARRGLAPDFLYLQDQNQKIQEAKTFSEKILSFINVNRDALLERDQVLVLRQR